MMPTLLGMSMFKNIRDDRLVHGGGHREYNEFVKYTLDKITYPEDFWAFHAFLKRNCRYNLDNIPWD